MDSRFEIAINPTRQQLSQIFGSECFLNILHLKAIVVLFEALGKQVISHPEAIDCLGITVDHGVSIFHGQTPKSTDTGAMVTSTIPICHLFTS